MKSKLDIYPPQKAIKDITIDLSDGKNTASSSFSSSSSAAAYATSLLAATAAFVAALIVNALAALPVAEKVGFKNTTSAVSNIFYTQITPAGWTFAIWSVIYVWQAAILGYGWTFVSQPPTVTVPFSPQALIQYTGVNICNIVWIFLWGYELPQYSFPAIFILELLLYASIRSEAQYLFQLEESMDYYTANHKEGSILKVNLNFTRYLILNGMSVYGTWITAANLINLAIVLEYYGSFSASFAGTVSLVLLGADVVMYFILENTLVGNFARYVFVVYPTLIWALSGILYAHANESGSELNEFITLILLGGSAVLLIAKSVRKGI